jgi:hypothetical protein
MRRSPRPSRRTAARYAEPKCVPGRFRVSSRPISPRKFPDPALRTGQFRFACSVSTRVRSFSRLSAWRLAVRGYGWMQTGTMSGTLSPCCGSSFVLSILEISLSFDNAVVNAAVLEDMDEVWQRRFLTWGMVIAVFGMRIVFPLAIVAIAAGTWPG